jgi:hypothetical protein
MKFYQSGSSIFYIGYDLSQSAIHVDARDEFCAENFMVCETKEIITSDYRWLPEQPDDWTVNEMCLIYGHLNDSKGERGLLDTTCHYRYVYVCKVNDFCLFSSSFELKFEG